MSSRLIFHTYVNTVQVALSYFRWGLGLVYKLPTVPLSPWIRSQETWDVAFLTTCLIPNKTRGCPGFSWNKTGMQQWDGSVYWFPSFPKSFRCVSLSLAVCGSPQMDQSFNTNPERGHRAQSCLSLLLGFPLPERQRGNERSRGDHPFLDSICKHKSPNTNPLKKARVFPSTSGDLGSSPGLPAQWLIGEVFSSKTQREDEALTAGWGACRWVPSSVFCQ